MFKKLKVTIKVAQSIMLGATGLLTKPKIKPNKEDIVKAVFRLGVLQIDTINVVERSPYIVLFSRLGNFENNWLIENLENGNLFEYWSHEACFIADIDFVYYRSIMLNAESNNWHYHSKFVNEHKEEIKKMLKYIEINGSVSSIDFNDEKKDVGGWWNWKIEKLVLEALFTRGELMIKNRINFRRIYDLTIRVKPNLLDYKVIPINEVKKIFIERTILHLGIVKEEWIYDYYRLKKKDSKELVQEQIRENKNINQIEVEGFKVKFYFHKDNFQLINDIISGKLKPTHSTVLSPFDPLIWDRKRVKELFDFDYKIECYTPESKRKFGYFCLPILLKGKLIGKLDAKAHRKDSVFEIKKFWLETGVVLKELDKKLLIKTIQQFATFNKMKQVVGLENL